MNELEYLESNEPFERARRELEVAVYDRELIDYADGYGLLTLDRISGERLMSARIYQLAYGEDDWPREDEDSLLTLTPMPEFQTDKEFIASLCPEDQYGKTFLATSHFFTMLSQQPRQEGDHLATPLNYYGYYPVVHRAHALAPELFDSLSVVLSELSDQYKRVAKDDELRQVIEMEGNIAIQRAMHMAYRIMGRLIKVNDPGVISKRFRTPPDYQDGMTTILSSDEFLREGYR